MLLQVVIKLSLIVVSITSLTALSTAVVLGAALSVRMAVSTPMG